MLFTRIVSMQLKLNAGMEFSELFDKKILPALRKQPGFRDELLFVDPGGPEVVAISMWDSKEHADSYEHAVYPEMMKILANVTDGAPKVRPFQLAYSTFHKIAMGAAASDASITSTTPGVGG